MNDTTAPASAKDLVTIPAADPAKVQLVTDVRHLSETLTGNRSLELHWAEKIKAGWQETVESFIAFGCLLIEAKDALPRGRFEAMVEADLGGHYSLRTLERFMAIARDARLTNRHTVSLLPPHWGTLHALTRLQDDVFQAKLDAGVICPEMTRKDARPPRQEEETGPDLAREVIKAIRHLERVRDLLDEADRHREADDLIKAIALLKPTTQLFEDEINQRKAERSPARKEARSEHRKARKVGVSATDRSPIARSDLPAEEQPINSAPDPNAGDGSNSDGLDIPEFLKRSRSAEVSS